MKSILSILINYLNSRNFNIINILFLTLNSIIVTIEDDGIGIPDNRKADALRPFVRLDDARSSDSGGTGLGLSIAKTAIENHGGQLFLEDSDLGGLRVRVILPIE